MPVGVLEIERFRGHPFVKNRTFYINASLAKDSSGAFDVLLIDGERKMLQRPLALVFLKHNHAGIAPGF